MKQRKIMVFGARGMLGTYLITYLSCITDFDVSGVDRKSYNPLVSSVDDLLRLFTQLQLDENSVVINALGLIPQAEKQHGLSKDEDYYKVNSIFPNILATICHLFKIRFIHISTDCVFSGKNRNQSPNPVGTGYHEEDLCDETTIYGFSKSLGEPVSRYCSVIRCSLIGEERETKRSLLEWVRQQKSRSIEGYTNQYWNGVTCLQLVHIIQIIIQSDLWWDGIRHIYSPHSISKYELITYIAKMYNVNVNISPKDLPVTIDKRLASKYSLSSMLNVPDIQTQITNMKNFNLLHQYSKYDIENRLI